MKLIFCCLLLTCAHASAQEEVQVVQQGRRYLDFNIHALDKYSHRIERQQKQLLNRLKRKEDRFVRQLKQKDSAAYARYQSQQLSYDSIGRLLKPDSATITARTKYKVNKVVDSLKGVQAFIQGNAAKAGINDPELGKYNTELSGLQQKLDYNEYINGLISQHTNSLKGLGSKANIPALSSIEQQLFYGKSKMAAWKQVADEPDRLEQKALEYLQGSKGFDQQLQQSTAGTNSMQAGMSGDDLEKMGFQTRSSMDKALQQKFGNNIGQIQQRVGAQISDYQEKTQGALTETKQAKQRIKQTAQQAKNIHKPSFRINPMRGKPFWLRLQQQYDFQTLKATNGKPAILSLSAGIGYKQTMKVSYGIGGICNIGLGQNWSNIRFSFQGFGLRAYARWQWIYGIGSYGAFERTWKQNVFTGNKTSDPPSFDPTVHNTSSYTDACMIGIEKQYKISSKYNGSVQLLADIWWREKGLNSPLVLRFTTTTK